MRFRNRRFVCAAALAIATLGIQTGAADARYRALHALPMAKGSISWSNPHHAYVVMQDFSTDTWSVAQVSVDKKPTPTLVLSGPLTQFCAINGIAMGPQGNLYVSGGFGTNCQQSDVEGVEIFAPGAHGNVAPIASIEGPKALFNNPEGMAFDSLGNLYVAQFFGGKSTHGSINIFAPGATGNVAPIARLTGPKTLFDGPYYVAVDASGEIFVGQAPLGTQVLKFQAGAHGNVSPQADVTLEPYGHGFNELQVSGSTVYASVGYIRREGPAVYELNAADLSVVRKLTNPKFTIISADVDAAGKLYVQNSIRAHGHFGLGHLYEYNAGAPQPERVRPDGQFGGEGYVIVGP